jgi:hypothetical protein
VLRPNSPRQRILPRRQKPEIIAIQERLNARKVSRFIKKYTDLPFGEEIRITSDFLENLSATMDLCSKPTMRLYHNFQFNRNLILSLREVIRLESNLLSSLLKDISTAFGETAVLDEAFIAHVNTTLDSLACQNFVEEVEKCQPEGVDGDHFGVYDNIKSGEFGKALAHLKNAESSRTDDDNPLDSFFNYGSRCLILLKLDSIPELLLSVERFIEIAKDITLHSQWSINGDGKYGSLHFPGTRILQNIERVKKILKLAAKNISAHHILAKFSSLSQELDGLSVRY